MKKISEMFTFRKNSNNEIVVTAESSKAMALFLQFVILYGLGVADEEYPDGDIDKIFENYHGLNENYLDEFDEEEDYGVNI